MDFTAFLILSILLTGASHARPEPESADITPRDREGQGEHAKIRRYGRQVPVGWLAVLTALNCHSGHHLAGQRRDALAGLTREASASPDHRESPPIV